MLEKKHLLNAKTLFDETHDQLIKSSELNTPQAISASVQEALTKLCSELNAFRQTLTQEEYQDILNLAKNHPLKKLLHEDPFTKRVHDKPRGYAGDAKMLDYLYYGLKPQKEVSLLGKEILKFLRGSPAGRAVRERAQIIGRIVDSMINKKNKDNEPFRVLSIASGHAREMSTSSSFFNKDFQFTALDLDAKSLKKTKEDYAEYNVEILHWPISKLLKKDNIDTIGQFDLIYSCGLYDYLNESTAKKLTEIIIGCLLKADGKFVTANFMEHYIRGYMEAFMNWNLIYRDIIDMDKIFQGIPNETIRNKKIYKERNGVILFYEINALPIGKLNNEVYTEPTVLPSKL